MKTLTIQHHGEPIEQTLPLGTVAASSVSVSTSNQEMTCESMEFIFIECAHFKTRTRWDQVDAATEAVLLAIACVPVLGMISFLLLSVVR